MQALVLSPSASASFCKMQISISVWYLFKSPAGILPCHETFISLRNVSLREVVWKCQPLVSWWLDPTPACEKSPITQASFNPCPCDFNKCPIWGRSRNEVVVLFKSGAAGGLMISAANLAFACITESMALSEADVPACGGARREL